MTEDFTWSEMKPTEDSPLSLVLELNLKDLIHLCTVTSTWKSAWHTVDTQQMLAEGVITGY